MAGRDTLFAVQINRSRLWNSVQHKSLVAAWCPQPSLDRVGYIDKNELRRRIHLRGINHTADSGLRVGAAQASEALLGLAEAFLTARGTAWRVRELSDLAPLVDAVRGLASEVGPVDMPVSPGLPIGVLRQDTGGVSIGVAPVFSM